MYCIKPGTGRHCPKYMYCEPENNFLHLYLPKVRDSMEAD